MSAPAGWHPDPHDGTADPHAKPTSPGYTKWTVLGVIVLLLAGLVAIGALAGDTAGETIEDLLPKALEENYAKQGLAVDVTTADCGDLDLEDGPFGVACAISIAGSSRTVPANIRGTILGDTINVTSASSTSNLVNEELAVKAVQDLVTKVAPTVDVSSCVLPEEILVLRQGDRFTCTTENDDEIEVTATSGTSIEITNVR
jgi:hypothetical protein